MDHEGDDKQSTRVGLDADWKLLAPHAGVTIIYFPFLRNPNVEGIDPDTSPFLSTWNFIYSPQEIDKVVALARANFAAGSDQTKRTVRAVYERKRAKRLEKEEEEKIYQWTTHLKYVHFGAHPCYWYRKWRPGLQLELLPRRRNADSETCVESMETTFNETNHCDLSR